MEQLLQDFKDLFTVTDVSPFRHLYTVKLNKIASPAKLKEFCDKYRCSIFLIPDGSIHFHTPSKQDICA